MQEGKSLSTALDATGHVEPLTVEMIRVGESTGALGEMLNQVADFYDEDLEVKVQTILSLVEPVLLVFMAVVIGSMVLALYLPMFEMFSAIQSRTRRLGHGRRGSRDRRIPRRRGDGP